MSQIQILTKSSETWGDIDNDAFWKLVAAKIYTPLITCSEVQFHYFEGMKLMNNLQYEVILDPKADHTSQGYIVRVQL